MTGETGAPQWVPGGTPTQHQQSQQMQPASPNKFPHQSASNTTDAKSTSSQGCTIQELPATFFQLHGSSSTCIQAGLKYSSRGQSPVIMKKDRYVCCSSPGPSRRTMARRPFLTSFSALASELRLAGSKGKESRKPDCRQAPLGQESSQPRFRTRCAERVLGITSRDA